ncbi:MAG TPA: SGNH/GDSL hydrolase family protein [Candidatus Polarisedimenticolaceae bacterium]|nr:SGNH/GDSL hydrolase family protein [Candidatus Polarisedimenticolaceae bacterium]
MRPLCFALLVGSLSATPTLAQVSGTAFEDRNGNGIQDAGEPGLPGVQIEVFGTRDAGGAFDQTASSTAAGDWSAAPGNGCYLVLPADPTGWRLTQTRNESYVKSTPGYVHPVGRARLAKLDLGIANLKTGAFRYASMGDSIARNFNACTFPAAFTYTNQVRARLQCTAPAAVMTADNTAVLGEDTDDLLTNDGAADGNNVFAQIQRQPDLITLSIIGNDMKDIDPPTGSQTEINAAVGEMIDSRQNLQEILSAFASEIPGADVTLNTLYDNLAYNCYTGTSTAFHRQWFPVLNQMLRDLAWGQTRRFSTNEVGVEFAHEDQQAACFGFDGQICRDLFGLDRIHPTDSGYTVVREKVWEADGGVNLGPKDALARTAITADYGFLRRVRRIYPSTWEARSGASITDPTAAFSETDGGAPAGIALGSAAQEVRFAGFPDWWDEIAIVKVLAGVRYRTSGTVGDDFYRIEASINDQFRPPAGFNYTPTSWNFFTPIVGSGGPDAAFPNVELLVRPNVAAYREVSATLTKNAVLAGGAGEYSWPALTHADLATTTFRVAAAPKAATPGNDAYQVQLDAAWLDLYGYEKPRPPEVSDLRLTRLGDGTVLASFAPLSGAQRYNVYQGHLDTLRAGGLDHGAGALCAAPTSDAGGGRLQASVSAPQQVASATYWLVTAHVSDVESPSGTATGGAELDRAQSTCH